MDKGILEGPLSPPPGRPSWGGRRNLSLIYLGWGARDFQQAPLAMHCDRATNYHIVMRGEIIVVTEDAKRVVRGPTALLFDPACVFGLTQACREKVDVLVWVWKGRPISRELRPTPGTFLARGLQRGSLDSLAALHMRCRDEVARADEYLTQTLVALRKLIEVEILRASGAAHPTDDFRWKLANSWMINNLSIHAPVPALCDYLRMSSSTLYRFFRQNAAMSPGAYFRDLKVKEARRLILDQGWQVKATAYHLGYRHPNELSRALAGRASAK
jgi:AraC-like DNA-binding protein